MNLARASSSGLSSRRCASLRMYSRSPSLANPGPARTTQRTMAKSTWRSTAWSTCGIRYRYDTIHFDMIRFDCCGVPSHPCSCRLLLRGDSSADSCAYAWAGVLESSERVGLGPPRACSWKRVRAFSKPATAGPCLRGMDTCGMRDTPQHNTTADHVACACVARRWVRPCPFRLSLCSTKLVSSTRRRLCPGRCGAARRLPRARAHLDPRFDDGGGTADEAQVRETLLHHNGREVRARGWVARRLAAGATGRGRVGEVRNPSRMIRIEKGSGRVE